MSQLKEIDIYCLVQESGARSKYTKFLKTLCDLNDIDKATYERANRGLKKSNTFLFDKEKPNGKRIEKGLFITKSWSKANNRNLIGNRV